MLRNPSLPGNPKSILFICKGNICRSPYAEYALPRLLKESHWEKLQVSSAGLIVPKSEKSPAEAVATAKKFGVDMQSHTSRPLTLELVEEYDIIVAMEAWQVQKMKKQYPKYLRKFFLLPLFDSAKPPNTEAISQYNIEDPYGKSADRFYASFRRIERCIESLVKQSGTN